MADSEEQTESKRPGLFCLEGDWDDGSRETHQFTKLSVRPMLELIEFMDYSGGTIHRDTATRAEFEYYLDRWLALPPKDYPLAYLASHGGTGSISLSYTDDPAGGRTWDSITLTDLRRRIKRKGRGRVLYFGSCEVMKAETATLQEFCLDTGISALVGYTETVDWLESAACDLLVLARLMAIVASDGPKLRSLDGRSFRHLADDLNEKHHGFARDLGFKIVTATWASTP